MTIQYVSTDSRPVGGIIFAGLFAVFSMVTTVFILAEVVRVAGRYNPQTAPQPGEELYWLFPEMMAFGLAGSVFGIVLQLVLLVGMLLSAMGRRSGHKVVRVVCYVVIAWTFVAFAGQFIFMATSNRWVERPEFYRNVWPVTQLASVLLGASLFGLIIYLFRKRRWG